MLLLWSFTPALSASCLLWFCSVLGFWVGTCHVVLCCSSAASRCQCCSRRSVLPRRWELQAVKPKTVRNLWDWLSESLSVFRARTRLNTPAAHLAAALCTQMFPELHLWRSTSHKFIYTSSWFYSYSTKWFSVDGMNTITNRMKAAEQEDWRKEKIK